MVPTFTLGPFDGLGAQLCPCGFATATPQTFTVASQPATPTDEGVLCTEVRMRTANQPMSARFEAGGFS